MRNKRKFCNYKERATWARKWIRAKNKQKIVKNFCLAFPNRYDYATWHSRTIARNRLVNWALKYNLGTLKYKKSKGNWVPKKKSRVKDLDPSDIDVYQDIVEDIFKNHNISKDEIARRIKEKNNKLRIRKICVKFLR